MTNLNVKQISIINMAAKLNVFIFIYFCYLTHSVSELYKHYLSSSSWCNFWSSLMLVGTVEVKDYLAGSCFLLFCNWKHLSFFFLFFLQKVSGKCTLRV